LPRELNLRRPRERQRRDPDEGKRASAGESFDERRPSSEPSTSPLKSGSRRCRSRRRFDEIAARCSARACSQAALPPGLSRGRRNDPPAPRRPLQTGQPLVGAGLRTDPAPPAQLAAPHAFVERKPHELTTLIHGGRLDPIAWMASLKAKSAHDDGSAMSPNNVSHVPRLNGVPGDEGPRQFDVLRRSNAAPSAL